MRHYLLLVISMLSFFLVNGQVKTKFNNQEKLTEKGKFSKNYETMVDIELPAKDIKQLLAKESAENKGTEVKPFRIAEPVPIDIDVVRAIKWVTTDGMAYGKYTLRLKGALSVSINFDRFYLPEGTEMYVYNENGEMITGPITEAENNALQQWGSWVYKGGILTIEVKTPAKSKNEMILHANNIAYGYKEIYKVANFGASGPCNINVLCPLGNGWEAERNAVALVLGSSGAALCSGSMVMNTCNSNQPYFLTANHCFDADGNAGAWRFTFQAWSPTCSPSQNSDGITFNGSTLRARNANSDFCLVELNNIPPANSNIHYAGWSRSTTPATQATAIHHPRGDIMKISRANNGTTVGSFAGTTNQHWRADWSPHDNGTGTIVTAVTEPGSSGSPLFDQDHRVIGQLHGGPSACGATNLWDFYGRFDVSWTGGGTPQTRLLDWLDRLGTNAQTTNTTNIANLQNGAANNPFPTGVTWATSNYNTYNGPLLSSYSFFLPSGQSGLVTFNITDTRYTNITWTPISTPSGSSWASYGPNNQQLNLSITAQGAPYSSNTITVRMNAQGPCGPFTMNFSATAVVRGWSIAATPNPAQSNVQVTIQEQAGKNESESLTMMLYSAGATNLLRKWDFKNNRTHYNLNLSGLKKGQYILVVRKGKDQQSKQIMIE